MSIVRFMGSILCAGASLLAGCATSTKPSPAPDQSQVLAACPLLTPLADDTMGAVVLKLQQVAGQYRECRAAALGEKGAR